MATSKPSAEQLITDNIDVWTSAIKKRGSQGRGSSKKIELYGIKKLRELILELAVRGLLVPQDPSDEPASVLLEKVAAEKERLIKDGKIKKQKPLVPVSDQEKLFDLPKGWSWSRIGEFSIIGPRNSLDDKLEVSFVPMPLVSTSYKGEHGQEIRLWSDLKKGYTHFADGDIGLAKITPCFENSKASIFSDLKNGFGAGTTELHIARPLLKEINPLFVLLYLKAPMFLEVGKSKMTGSAGQKRIPKSFFEGNPFPLPPEAEQPRIDAKVNELMALCDQLEQQTETSLTAHQTLVETLLNALLTAAQTSPTNTNKAASSANSSQESSFDQAWNRIAQHFDVLFTTEHSIDQLKQTILQLAVMGKLVPQDPNDEPASVLLDKAYEARDLWLADNLDDNPECKTMLKKLKKLDKAKEPFPLPSSWACTHLIQVSSLLVDCHNKTAPYVDDGIPIIRTTNIREREFKFAGMKYVDEGTYNYWSRRCPPAPGDIMFTREAPMGEGAIIPEGVKWCLGQRTMLIRPLHDFIDKEYLLLALTEPHLLERASEHAVGLTVKHLRVGDVERLNIPMPPLSEQHRIVARVNVLMRLCRDLKAKLGEIQVTQLHLANTMAEQALNKDVISG